MLSKYDITVFQADETDISNNFFYKILNFSNLNRTKNIKPMITSIISRKALNRIRSEFNITTFRSVEYKITGLDIFYVQLPKNLKFKKIDLDYNELLDIAIIHSNLIFKYTSYLITLFFFLSIFSLLYTSYFYLTKNVIEGWSTIMSFLSISFFGIFLVLYLFLRYLHLMLKNLFYKKTTFVDKIEII